VDEGKVKTRFADVAGVDEAKDELVEVVDFLKQPKKYTDIGGKIPKGVLLVGPPGTGKTLLARAVAGEAGVPFFRISGSDFVEMFVGVGASRVRDLFRTAREKAPCIIFIDEIDAIGKSRVNSISSNDEREQTLNQLLVEMDGFDNEKGLIILAATNRADVLDPALLRPGRFDRQVPVERPDVKGREAILRIHSKNVKLEDSVDFESLAHGTIGFAGADLANVVNEAALLAVRNGHTKVTMDDFNDAIDKVSIGLKKKTRRENEMERRLVAVHETGHALVGAFTPDYPPVNKITVVPRSNGIGGFTQYREEEEKHLKTYSDLINEVDTLLGGRAAEEVVFNEISTGASNDISRATGIIKSMITDYGMSKRFKNVMLGKAGRGYGAAAEPELVREFSEDTQKYIDEEIARITDERYNYVVKLLKTHRELLDYVSSRLLEKETIDGKEFEEIVKAEKHCADLTEKAKAGTKKAAVRAGKTASKKVSETKKAETKKTRTAKK
ncbi:MAG: ATP-dependent zinc metalloprotease FtsH, partial [Treponema sp.]|nr:ATP-dependent zinc metalloprotease FtsH [Treponema sp.]